MFEFVIFSLELFPTYYQDEQFLNSKYEILGDVKRAFVPTNTLTMWFTLAYCATEQSVHGDGEQTPKQK